MKYLAGIGKGKAPVFSPGGTGAGTLTFEAPLNKKGGSHLLTVLNTTTNDIIYNSNNPALSGTFSGGDTDGDLVLTLDIDTLSFNADDDLHAWVEYVDGSKGVDFLSELSVKDKTYAAMKNVELSTESVIVDNTQQTVLLQTTIDKLDELLSVPDTFFVNTGEEAMVGDYLDIDLTNYTKIISIRSMHDDTVIDLGTSDNQGQMDDILDGYALPNGDFLDIKSNYITITGTNAKVLITVI